MVNRRRKVPAVVITPEGQTAHVPTQLPVPSTGRPRPRLEPARTSKTTQKLVVFPDADIEQRPTEPATSPTEITLHEELKGVAETPSEQPLRRVTAYLTAESYRLRELQEQLMTRGKLNFVDAKRYDEVLYSPFYVDSPKGLLTLDLEAAVASAAPVGEVFFFDYGVVVIWGLEEEQEQLILRELQPFEIDRLALEDVEVENFYFSHNPDRPPRLFNDVINLRSGHHMVKLTISHALAQSVKLATFEELIDSTILKTKNIPYELSSTGSIRMSRKAINKQIGELFVMRMNVNLISNVLDTPELFWSYPSLGPLYRAVRGYLEISQRVEVLNQRCAVLSDMLDMLRDHANIMHGETLEWIIILLIALEIFIGLAKGLIDLLTSG